jgi:DNA-binding GntR family transcriptional regulator
VTDVPEERISLGEAAYRRLYADIVTCRLAPGQRLTEKQLSSDTGFGVSPLREALTRLGHDGLVRTLPRKGYQVRPLTPKSIDDLFDVWQLLGPELIRRGVAHANAEQLESARTGFASIDELVRGERGPEVAEQLIAVTAETFAGLAAATNNEYLIHLYRHLAGDMARTWVLVLASDPHAMSLDPADFWLRHILSQRDAEAAAEIARTYIADMHRRVLHAVLRWPSVMSAEVIPVQPPPAHDRNRD